VMILEFLKTRMATSSAWSIRVSLDDSVGLGAF